MPTTPPSPDAPASRLGLLGADGTPPPLTEAVLAGEVVDEGARAAGARAAAGTTGRSVLAGGVWNVFALLLPQMLVLISSAAAARYLGPSLTGRQSFIAFVQLTAVALIGAGLPVALMRTVAAALGEGRTAEMRGLLSWAGRRMLVYAVLALGVLVVSALVSGDDTAAWLLAGVVAFTSLLQTIPGAVLIGMQRWRQASLAGLVTGVPTCVALVVVLANGGGITDIFLIEAIATTINLAWTTGLARRAVLEVAPHAAPAGDLRQRTTSFARPNALLAVLETVVYKRSEFLFLARYSPSSEIGYYSVAFAAVSAAAQLPQAMTGMASSFATLHAAGEHDRVRTGFTRGCRLLLLVSLVLLAGMASLGAALVDVVFGDEYARAGHLLQIMLITFPVLPLAALSDALLVGRGDIRVPLRALGAAVAVNLLLAAVLVPPYDATGAAVSSVAAQLVASVPIVVHAFRVVGVRRTDLHLGRLAVLVAVTVAAAGAAAVADQAVGHWSGLFLGAAVFSVVWLPLAAAAKVLVAEDGAWLADALPQSVGRPGRRLVQLLTART